MSLGVYWDGEQVGLLEPANERSRDYTFAYTDRSRPISLALPVDRESFTVAESRPFFEALLPEGAVRELLAQQLKLAASDTYGLLAELGRDCAGALQIVETKRMSETPGVRWLTQGELDEEIEELPRRPLGIRAEDERVRLSLAGVQRKAVLVRDAAGQFGEPLNGMPSTHILKPDAADSDYPGLAVNECFCMRLAERCGLSTAKVELIVAAGRPCLVVERFDRDLSASPARRIHQEDLCQALGLTPDFKYQKEGWRVPSYEALGGLLEQHGERPGADRLAAARAAVYHYLVGNADAHAKNTSLLHGPSGVRMAPLYDVVSTAAYPDLSSELALAIGDELDPEAIGPAQWVDLAADLGLQPRAFERERARLADSVQSEAVRLRDEALADGWHDAVVDATLAVIEERASRVR
jgi:serine/threonine-protein kinase HipA